IFTHPISRLLSTFHNTLLKLRPGPGKKRPNQVPSLLQMIRSDYLNLGQVLLHGYFQVRNRKTRQNFFLL
ncbi:hypothetical protein WN55_07535, partial [Dufourea novaeangliae]